MDSVMEIPPHTPPSPIPYPYRNPHLSIPLYIVYFHGYLYPVDGCWCK